MSEKALLEAEINAIEADIEWVKMVEKRFQLLEKRLKGLEEGVIEMAHMVRDELEGLKND